MVASLDAPILRRAMDLFAEALGQHRDEINSLNVFPIPDGDTGTNLLLTQYAVVSELAALDGEPAGLRELGDAISRASLLGARGNSGVILSQVLRGLCDRLAGERRAGPQELAAGLRHASEEADRAVARPQDGTVLSVLRDAAGAATKTAAGGADVAAVARAAVEEGRSSLARTREILPELRRAGVVDAGGKGLVLLLDAFLAALEGREVAEPVGPMGPVREGGEAAHGEEPDFEFEVQYLLEAPETEVGALRKALADIGDSVVVVGGGGLFNVHVHTDHPDRAVDAGREVGHPRDLSTVSLRDQVSACIGGQARAVQVAEQVCGLVAVAVGSGLEGAFRSLGALVVRGGPGDNPSVADLLRAIDAAGGEAVLVLPNHPNIVPAAEQAARAASKEVWIVPTRSAPAGLAAATAFNPVETLAANAAAASDAAEAVRAGEVARAEREAASEVGAVRAGDWLGLAEGQIAAVAPDPVAAAGALVRRLAEGGAEIVTIVSGQGASEAQALAAAIRKVVPEAEVQVIEGGQPRYRYLIGVE